MGEIFLINRDGSVSHYTMVKVINNIELLDYKQVKGKYTAIHIAFFVLCIFPIYGQVIYLLSSLTIRRMCGYWPFFGIRAIKQKNVPIRIYCSIQDRMRLYAKKQRVTPSIFHSEKRLPTIDCPAFIYCPAFILGRQKQFCLYNYNRNNFYIRILKIIYLGDNPVLIMQNGKKSKFPLIWMCLGIS